MPKECPLVYAYADDTTLLCIDNSWIEVELEMNEYLSKLSVWFIQN